MGAVGEGPHPANSPSQGRTFGAVRRRSNMNPAVGIDLGTSNTVVAVQTDDTGPRLVMIPQPIEERRTLEPRDQIKSVVFFESATTAVVGAFAARRLEAIRSIKSRMGTRWRM